MPMNVSLRSNHSPFAIRFRVALQGVAILLISACSHLSTHDQDGAGEIPKELPVDAEPRVEAKSPYGNPKSYVVFGKRYHTLESSRGFVETGIASWYGKKFHGIRTSSGEPYNMYAMTAAHKSLPLPCYVRVTNLTNKRSIVLRVNDRGPFSDNRVIDLSYAAALKLDIVNEGTALVEVRAIDPMTDPVQRVVSNVPAADEQVSNVTSDNAQDMDMFIQVGAFSSRENAERLGYQLGLHNINSVQVNKASEQTQVSLYKVRIGPLASIRDADRTTQVLERIGLVNYRVIYEPSKTEQGREEVTSF